jgi:RNA polymerase sigma-70 factor (ECF subfamily)
VANVFACKPARLVSNLATKLPELMRRTAVGDKSAFADLYQATSAKLFGIALRISGRREIAEEVLQEAFVAIWGRAKDYDPVRGSVMTWLVTIVRHCAIDQLRHQQSRPEGHSAPEEVLTSFIATGRSDISAELRALQRCLDELDPQPRKAVLLAYLYGLTRDEIAARLKVPVGTVKSSLWRSLERLQRCLGS